MIRTSRPPDMPDHGLERVAKARGYALTGQGESLMELHKPLADRAVRWQRSLARSRSK